MPKPPGPSEPGEWSQDDIDAQMLFDANCPDEEDEEPGDECGRWIDGRLGRHCSKAGSEECDWECPYR